MEYTQWQYLYYVGQHEKLTESDLSLSPIQMGARVYIPGLGRFLSVDPQQGGTNNNYVYVTDPINDFDLDGNFGWKSLANIASWASIIPGPIGMIAGGVAAVSYAAAGDYKSAAIAAVGIAAAAVGAGAVVKAAQAAKSASTALKVANEVRSGSTIARSLGKVAIKGAQDSKIINGYTRHGLNQAISNDGHGVAVRAIYDAVKNQYKL